MSDMATYTWTDTLQRPKRVMVEVWEEAHRFYLLSSYLETFPALSRQLGQESSTRDTEERKS